MNNLFSYRRLSIILSALIVLVVIAYGCSKSDDNGEYEVNDSLTLFKLDNNNNALDLQATDTVLSQSGVNGKYILVSGAAGASKGLDSIRLSLLNEDNETLNTVVLSSFFKPEYHVINSQLVIPAEARGQVYHVAVEVLDKTGAVIGSKTFLGQDVVTCDPLPPCLVANQITVLVETPPGTPEGEISLFGSLNGWNRGDKTFALHKNPDVPNCYCVSLPFPPGSGDWQLGEVFITRGDYANDAVTSGGDVYIVKYSDTEMGPIWKIKVERWRDQ